MAGIGVFGGTFNPPHLGHQRLVRRFADRLSLSEVLIIPTYIPPHKRANELASSGERLEMCRLMFSGDSRFRVSSIEIDRGGKSYTYDTLKELKRIYPDDRLYLIVGSDMLRSFCSWHRPDDILKLCTVCAAARDSGGVPPNISHKVIFDDMEPLLISSTAIREMAGKNGDITGLVGEAVAGYISQRGLYAQG